MKIAVFAGTFDPITYGHIDLIKRSVSQFDQVIVLIAINKDKTCYFPLEKRLLMVKKAVKDIPNVIVDHYDGLTVNYAKMHQAHYLIRGVRNEVDRSYEKVIAKTNKEYEPSIETILLEADPSLIDISSTKVKELYINKKDISKYVPLSVIKIMEK